MRRRDREVTDAEAIELFISKQQVIRIGFYDNGEVYIAITFEFAENGQVQNPYIDFGTAGDHADCKLERDILCWYSQATTSAN